MPRDHVEHEAEHHDENDRANADQQGVQVVYVVRDDGLRRLEAVVALTACGACRKAQQEAGEDLRGSCGHGCPQTMAWQSQRRGLVSSPETGPLGEVLRQLFDLL